MQDATIVFLLKGNPISEVLLGYKKIGFGQGKYAGFGGKIESGEGKVEAALRELDEETGVGVPDPESLEFRAILEFRFPHNRDWEHRAFVFTTHKWEGIPTESNEMTPQWFAVENIPYDQMWDDARYWLPLILSGEKFQGCFMFKVDNTTVEEVEYAPLLEIRETLKIPDTRNLLHFSFDEDFSLKIYKQSFVSIFQKASVSG